MECDVAVLGGGPGGYPAAIRAAQLGAKVALIEQARVGGTCITIGCIPTKTWVQTAHALKDAQHTFAQLGVNVEGVTHDFSTTQKNKETIVNGLVNGITGVVKANGIEVVSGRGRFKDANTIAVDGGEDIAFKQAIIATGSHPLRPPVDGIDGPLCVDSTGLLEVTEVPGRIVILGGGVIGVEFASILSHFASEVTIVEMLDSLIPTEDADASRELHRAFKKRGITMHLGARATRIEHGSAATLHFESSDGTAGQVEADLVLVATGRGPNTSDIGLEEAGVAFDPRKGIEADESMRTNVPHIFAVGDVAGKWQLAHTSFREGEVAAENALGHATEVDYAAVPRCIYTDPEVAGVGLTEAQARDRYGDEVAVGRAPFSANARAQMYADKTGWVKTIHETHYGELLGLVLVGPQATELVNAGVVGITAEATIETLADSIAAHPTLAESVKEAALVALGRPIHLPPAKPRARAVAAR
ncbi:MAG TPA: dihydrolipoyl dehydrogenase [Gaiellales bacterium]|jgi:dihydrolipoamide dehydrogenase|nr:dihydrolipoyl dehydrogenase [Gaiellales bacterium]